MILGSYYWKKHHLLFSSPNKRFEQIGDLRIQFKVLLLKASSQEQGDLSFTSILEKRVR